MGVSEGKGSGERVRRVLKYHRACIFVRISLSLSLFLSLFLLCMHTLPLLSSQNPKSPHRRFISPFTGISAQSSDPTASPITAPLPNQKKKKKKLQLQPKAKPRSVLLRQQPQNLNETSFGDCWLRR